MATDVSLPSVVLFVEKTGRLEVFQKIVSGLQRGGRRVHVLVGSADALFNPRGAGAATGAGRGWQAPLRR